MKNVLFVLIAVAVIMCATAAQAASLTTAFQATIASEQNPNYAGEARYYHVSVNPSNPGIGSYAATIVGTNDPADPWVRPFTEDVVSYKWIGGTNNDISGISVQGGETARITYATQDTVFDGFGQQQLKLWTTTDPGADIQTTIADPYNAIDDVGNTGGYRSFGGAVGTVDISGLATGSVYVFYGAFKATPSVSAVMRDTDGIAPDITIADAHLNGDYANRTEYYVAELDFVSDGVYDVIEYTHLANGTDYTGNGRGLGTLLTGTEASQGTLGDLNGDSVVDAADYIVLKQNFGTASGATPEMGDIALADGTPGQDGAVDMNDVNLLAAQFVSVGQAVPEPATLGLLAFGAVALLRRKS